MRLEGPSLAQKSEGHGTSEALQGALGATRSEDNSGAQQAPSAPVAKSVPSHAQNNPLYLSFISLKKKLGYVSYLREPLSASVA